jgi:hypothetical protein
MHFMCVCTYAHAGASVHFLNHLTNSVKIWCGCYAITGSLKAVFLKNVYSL